MQKTKSPAAKQGKSTTNSTILLVLKRLVKFLLVNVQGYITPNTYRIYDKLFQFFDLREV